MITGLLRRSNPNAQMLEFGQNPTWRVNIHLTNFLMGDAEPEWASGHSVRERGEMVLLQPNTCRQVGENKQAYNGMRAFNWRGVEQTPLPERADV